MSVVVVRVTAWPAVSVPLSCSVTPAMPASAASRPPLLSASSQTRPLIVLLFGISAKLLPVDSVPGVVSTMALIALGVTGCAVAVPPALPGSVRPLLVPAGCVGSVRV